MNIKWNCNCECVLAKIWFYKIFITWFNPIKLFFSDVIWNIMIISCFVFMSTVLCVMSDRARDRIASVVCDQRNTATSERKDEDVWSLGSSAMPCWIRVRLSVFCDLFVNCDLSVCVPFHWFVLSSSSPISWEHVQLCYVGLILYLFIICVFCL